MRAPLRVLFLCTGNTCRSQMAEGILRRIGGDRYEVFSAGFRPSGRVHPLAIQAMDEFGQDISKYRSKSLEEFAGQSFDYVITLCAGEDSCPSLPDAVNRLGWSFDDPVRAQGNDEEKLKVFRRVRDEMVGCLRLFAYATLGRGKKG